MPCKHILFFLLFFQPSCAGSGFPTLAYRHSIFCFMHSVLDHKYVFRDHGGPICGGHHDDFFFFFCDSLCLKDKPTSYAITDIIIYVLQMPPPTVLKNVSHLRERIFNVDRRSQAILLCDLYGPWQKNPRRSRKISESSPIWL